MMLHWLGGGIRGWGRFEADEYRHIEKEDE